MNRDYLLLGIAIVCVVAQIGLASTVAAAEQTRSQSADCVATDPGGPGGIPITVTRGPVDNSVTLSVDRVDARNADESTTGIVLPDGTSLHSKTGFKSSSKEEHLYETVRGSRNYSVTYTFAENGTLSGTSQNGVIRPYEGKDDWAVAPLPQRYDGRISYQSPSGAVIGQQTVYFGEYTMTTVSNGCHRIRLVVPDSVELNKNTTAILGTLRYTDRHLGGHRYDEVTIFVTPERFDSYGGVARESDIVISGAEIVNYDKRSHIWLHEYLHTRQTHWPDGDFAWWTEASANYLSLRMGLQSGYLSPDRYNYLLEDYGENKTGDAVLADTSTWHNFSTYKRGVLVLSRLDAELHAQTNGSVTLVSVFNATESRQPESMAEFMTVLGDQSGHDHDEWASAYVNGTTDGELKMKAETPSLYDRLMNSNPYVLVLGGVVFVGLVIEILREDKDE